VGRVCVGPVAGLLAESIGWPSFFIVATVVALPGPRLLALRATVQALDKAADDLPRLACG
jgi:MFS transporter, PAT family, beta-lactamase induction signal transducer AmpG